MSSLNLSINYTLLTKIIFILDLSVEIIAIKKYDTNFFLILELIFS